MPNRSTIYDWIHNNKVFSDKYARAKEVASDNAFDDLMSLAREAKENPALTQALKLIIDTDKWVLSKKIPKKYGDKQSIEHSGGVVFTAPKSLDD